MKKIFFLFLMAVMVTGVTAKTKLDTETLHRDGVSYMGRVQHEKNGLVRFDFTGVYARTFFTGGTIGVRISDTGTNYYRVSIDGRPSKRIVVTGREPHDVVLAENLSKGRHELCLQKVTEGSQGCTTIYGFLLARGGELSPVEPKKRCIEVYGDSYTCGYGVLAGGPKERFNAETEDVSLAYPAIIARYFNADYAVVAHSGQGLVRNYGDKQQRSKFTMLSRHNHVFDDFDSTTIYNFKAYRPQLVIIQLGTNDFSRAAIPTPEMYVEGYLKLLRSLRQHYGEVPVLCSLPYSATRYLQLAFRLLRERTATMKNVHIGEPMLDVIINPTDLGADWHPNRHGQQKIAMKMIPQISKMTGWELERKIIE